MPTDKGDVERDLEPIELVERVSKSFNTGLRGHFGNSDPQVVAILVRAMRPLLAGFTPEIQSAVLADLVAMHFAGYVGSDAPPLVDELLEIFVREIRELIPINRNIILENLETQGRG